MTATTPQALPLDGKVLLTLGIPASRSPT